jgi:hypothetical protein
MSRLRAIIHGPYYRKMSLKSGNREHIRTTGIVSCDVHAKGLPICLFSVSWSKCFIPAAGPSSASVNGDCLVYFYFGFICASVFLACDYASAPLVSLPCINFDGMV